jgi:uroporphyrinogen-III decarboxylase
MNSHERMMARLSGLPVDHLPAAPLFMIWAAQRIGASYADYVLDYRVLVKAQLALVEDFGVDVLSCCSDAWREARCPRERRRKMSGR